MARTPLDLLDPSPGGDLMSDGYDKTNAGLDYAVTDVAVNSGVLTVTANDGYTFNVPMPVGTDRVLSGLATTITGGGPFAIDWTAGTYQLLGVNHSIAGGSLPITAAHATLDRIDLLVVDDTETAAILEGTPAASPASPTPAANQLVVGIIVIPAASAPQQVQPGAWTATNLQPGTATGQVLLWNHTATRWERSGNIVSTTTSLTGGASTSVALYRFGTGSDGGGNITMSASAARMQHTNGAGYVAQMNLDSVSNRILLQSTGATEVHLDVDLTGGVKLKSATPAVTTYRLYNVGGTLYWHGAPVGGGGWDGYADTANIQASVDSPYTVAPTAPLYRVSVYTDVACTINLPASPTDGQVVEIKDRTYNAGSNNITINGNGNDIDSDTPLILNTSGASVKLTFVAANSNWEIG